ncbi:MAG: class I SAM-dependent methyltransferase [Planctomycetaceae bacterium]
MLPRTLEPEVMDTPAEAADYDAMDHAEVNRLFVADFLRAAGAEEGTVLDVGTGTALIPIELCRQSGRWRVVALDLAEEMLKLARRNVEREGFGDRIRLERTDAKSLPCADGSFDALMSNSIVHHIPKPATVLAEMVRVLRPGGLLFVRDLLRPHDGETVEQLVAAYAGGENEHSRAMFHASLHAALTLDEMRELLRNLGLSTGWVEQTSDRHWTLCGFTKTG